MTTHAAAGTVGMRVPLKGNQRSFGSQRLVVEADTGQAGKPNIRWQERHGLGEAGWVDLEIMNAVPGATVDPDQVIDVLGTPDGVTAVAAAVDSSNIVGVSLGDPRFGAARDGSAPVGAAITAAFDALNDLAYAFTRSGGGTSYRRPRLYIPRGHYRLDASLVVALQALGSVWEYEGLEVVGDGIGSTVLIVNFAGYGVDIPGGSHVVLRGIELRGNVAGACGVRLGGDTALSESVSQSVVSGIKTHNVATALAIRAAWDSKITNCFFASGQSGGIGIDVQPTDVASGVSINNIDFDRVHVQGISGGTLFKLRTNGQANGQHHHINSRGLHLESENADTVLVDWLGAIDCTHESPDFAQTNNAGDLDATLVNALKVQGTNIRFIGGSIRRSGVVSSAAAKLIKPSGVCNGILLSRMSLYDTGSGLGVDLDALLDVTALTTESEEGIVFEDVLINGANRPRVHSSLALGRTNRRFRWETDHTNRRIKLRYAENTDGSAWAGDPLLQVNQYGAIGPTKKNILDAASQTFTVDTSIAANGTELWLLLVDAPAVHAVIFAKRATTITSLTTHANVQINVDLAGTTAGNIGIQATGNGTIAIHNKIGSARDVTMLRLGFH